MQHKNVFASIQDSLAGYFPGSVSGKTEPGRPLKECHKLLIFNFLQRNVPQYSVPQTSVRGINL
jgi:hypothetical protein